MSKMCSNSSLDSSKKPNGCSRPDAECGSKRLRCWPEDVGIIAMEVYFPSQFVEQAELEIFDGVSQGKYTIGLGQSRMGFCTDREDINSLCLTALTKLVERTGIGYQSIGRLEVGTETIVDKSKSVKTALMSVFPNNSDVEGVDTTNACYGGTAALLNAVNWVESSAWDGRYAVVVAGDIAVYARGPARPTGGAGAVAMLVGPHAALVLDTGVRSSHMSHSYDFYKPDLSSEYPTVDGKLSIQCYFSALDSCYNTYLRKAKRLGVEGLCSFDAMLFHTPFCKLVQKSLARLAFNDFLNDKDGTPQQPDLEVFRTKTLEETYFDRDVEKAFMSASNAAFVSKTKPSLLLATQVGNMYTPSLYGGLASLLASHAACPDKLLGQRLGLFSYGSGLASTLYSITVKAGRPPRAGLCSSSGAGVNGVNSGGADGVKRGGANGMNSGAAEKHHSDGVSGLGCGAINGHSDGVSGSDAVARHGGACNSDDGLKVLVQSLADIEHRLKSRVKVSPQSFTDVMDAKERTHHLAPYSPVGDTSALFPGTWFLALIDDKYRRQYDRVPLQPESATSDAGTTILGQVVDTTCHVPAAGKACNGDITTTSSKIHINGDAARKTRL